MKLNAIKAIGALALCVLAGAVNAQTIALPARSDVLVVVNDNSVDSPQVGAYYANRRGIPESHVVHVRVPPQFFIDWSEFQSLRDQILRSGFCPVTYEAMAQVPACANPALPIYTESNLAYFRRHSGIRYVVTTRGVPTRMSTPQTGDPASVDSYLSFWLARHLVGDQPLFFFERAKNLGVRNSNGTYNTDTSQSRRRMRAVNPSVDLEYVVGRIDGLDLTSAQAIVDRTLLAEQEGFHGKVYTHRDGVGRGVLAQRDELRGECADDAQPSYYLQHPQGSAAGRAPQHCQVKFAEPGSSGWMPGWSGSRQPLADRAAVYFGDLDGQEVVGGMGTLLNYRKNTTCNSTLCANASDPTQCRAASTDPLREIDTRCVGVANGFLGFNYQSYPVANFGIWPTAWGPRDLWGAFVNDVPKIDTTRGVGDASSLWFTASDLAPNTHCLAHDGTLLSSNPSPCNLRVRIGLSQYLRNSAVAAASEQPYRFALHVKGEQLQAPVPLRVELQVSYTAPSSGVCPAGMQAQPDSEPLLCDYRVLMPHSIVNSSDWVRVEWPLQLPALPAGSRVQTAWFKFDAPAFHGAGRVGFDAITLTNLSTNAQLVSNGSFTEGHHQSARGDYAANFLSRLGGTAFWGSVGHHYTNGNSYGLSAHRVLGYLFQGLPLGDAVALGGPANSGFFYGDPLYSPTHVKLNALPDPESRIAGGQVVVWADVVQGRSLMQRTAELSVCPGGIDPFNPSDSIAPWRCDHAGGWETLSTRVLNAETRVPFYFTPAATTFPRHGDHTLRLRVMGTDPTTGEASAVSDFYPIKYRYSDAELDEAQAYMALSGRVLSPEGEPLRDVLITVRGTNSEVQTSTRVDGSYEFQDLLAGPYNVTATRAGCAAPSSEVVLRGANVLHDIRCTRVGNTLRGRVLSATGQPITDVSVFIEPLEGVSPDPSGIVSSANGYFESSPLPNGEYNVMAFHSTVMRWVFPAQRVVVRDGAVEVTVRANALDGATLSGRLRSTSGAPISLGSVQIYSNETADSCEVGVDLIGGFACDGLPPGTYTVNAQADGYQAIPPRTVVLASGSPPALMLDLTSVTPQHSISGYVTRYGAGLRGQYVALLRADGSKVTAVSSGAGYFRFDGLAPGSYQVYREINGAQVGTRTTVELGRTNVIEVNLIAN
jgi:uncharacterized protein (TIGR03790 family)